MEILVLGVILLVLGVGATYLYDHKEKLSTLFNSLNLFGSKKKSNVNQALKLENISNTELHQRLAKSAHLHKDSWASALDGIGYHKDGELPKRLSPKDFSIDNQSVTVSELIAKLESLKKK